MKEVRSDKVLPVETRLLQMLLECMQANVLGLDSMGSVRICSQGALEQTGFMREELMGRPLETFLDERSRPSFLQALTSSRGVPVVKNVPVSLLKKDGSGMHYHVTVYSLGGAKAEGFLLFLDQAQGERAERREFVVTQDDLIEIGRYKTLGQIAAGFVHQFRTPLQVVQTNVEYMDEFLPLPDEAKIHLKLIRQSIERLSHSVNSLLDFVREGKLVFTDGLLNPLIETAYEFVAADCRKKSIQIVKSLHSTASTRYDVHQIQEVVLNLMVNAIEAMSHGGRLIVQTEDEPGGEWVALRISDTGEGMDDYAAANAARPFFTTKRRGMGLGLFIAQKILEAHSATMSFRSHKGFGTTVTLRFPVRWSMSG